MAFREVSVNGSGKCCGCGWGGAGLPAPGLPHDRRALQAGPQTVRRYVEAAQAAGLTREDGVEALDDGLIGAVAEAVRPVRPRGHGAAWEQLLGFEEQISGGWPVPMEQRPLTVTKIHTLLARQGCVVPYRTLHRFACDVAVSAAKTPRCGSPTVIRGSNVSSTSGYLGMLTDTADGRRRKVYALIFTAVYSRHMFVWLSYSQTLAAVIAGCQAAWEFFGGVFAVLIPDNMKPVIAAADAVNPQLTVGWLDYAAYAGFATDPARVRSPKDKPALSAPFSMCVATSGTVKPSPIWIPRSRQRRRGVAQIAGQRIHGTTCARPAEVFTAEEQSYLPAAGPYDVPIFKTVKIHRDYHAEVAKALYSLPECNGSAGPWTCGRFRVGQVLPPRGTGQGPSPPAARVAAAPTPPICPNTRPATPQGPGPALIATCAAHGPKYRDLRRTDPRRPLPWTRMRTVYRLLGLVRRYGAVGGSKPARSLDLGMSFRSPRSRPCSSGPPSPPGAAQGSRGLTDPVLP